MEVPGRFFYQLVRTEIEAKTDKLHSKHELLKVSGIQDWRIGSMKDSEITEFEYFRETVPNWSVEASHPMWTWIPRRAMPWTGVMKQ